LAEEEAAKAEADRIAADKAEWAERAAVAQAQEQKRFAEAAAAKIEAERLVALKLEQERMAAEAKAQVDRAVAEAAIRADDAAATARIEKEAAAKFAADIQMLSLVYQEVKMQLDPKAEADRLAAAADAKAEEARLAEEEAAKAEADRIPADKAEWAEWAAVAQAEKDRLAAETAARAAEERLAQEAAVEAEAQKVAAAKAEEERLAAELKAEADRLAALTAAEAEKARMAEEAVGKAVLTVPVVRDSNGSAGFMFEDDGLTISRIEENRLDLHHLALLQAGDIIYAVNGVHVKDKDDFVKEAVGVPRFELTLHRIRKAIPCTSRRPCVGDKVRSADGSRLHAVKWSLEVGEVAMVKEVDDEGDFKLSNQGGYTSTWQHRDGYVYDNTMQRCRSFPSFSPSSTKSSSMKLLDHNLSEEHKRLDATGSADLSPGV
jgi:hypothetical protein